MKFQNKKETILLTIVTHIKRCLMIKAKTSKCILYLKSPSVICGDLTSNYPKTLHTNGPVIQQEVHN